MISRRRSDHSQASLPQLFVEAERQTRIAQLTIYGAHIWPALRALLSAQHAKKAETDISAAAPTPSQIWEVLGQEAQWGRTSADSFDDSHLTRLDRFLLNTLAARKHKLAQRAMDKDALKKQLASKTQSLTRLRTQLANSRHEAPSDILRSAPRELRRKQYEFLFFCRPSEHYQDLQGTRIAPIIDSWMDVISDFGTCAKVLNAETDLPIRHPEFVFSPSGISAHIPLPFSEELQTAISADFPLIAYAKLFRLQKQMADIDPRLAFNPKKVLDLIFTHRKNMLGYKILLQSARPKAVFVTSFTGFLPLIWAAHELGIPTIDLQHGGMANEHGLLTHYTAVPRGGVALLPTQVWCWSEATRALVAQWFKRAQSGLYIARVGNPWWDARVQAQNETSLGPEHKKFLETLAHKKVVLVSLVRAQTPLIAPAVLEAVKASPEDVLWLFRMHPLERDRAPELRRALGDHLERINIEDATTLPLPMLMPRTDVHLTPYSTTSKEAAACGIPTGFYDRAAETYFGQDVYSNNNCLCLSSDRITEHIATSRRYSVAFESSNMLDRSVVEKLLNILQNKKK